MTAEVLMATPSTKSLGMPWDVKVGRTSMDVLRTVKGKSEALRGKPTGTAESEIRSAISLLGQRPLRYTGVGRS